jgi:DNA replication protein DnaC
LINDHETDARYHAIRDTFERKTKKVLPFLDRATFAVLPDTMSATCESHGLYEFKHGEWLSGLRVDSMCPDCVRERQKAIDRLALEKYKLDTRNRVTDKLERSGVSSRNMDKTFSSFSAKTEKQKEALSTAMEYASRVCFFDEPFNLIMVGTTGTGKTHLAHAITHHCILAGRSCATIQLKNLIAEFRASWRDSSAPSDRTVIKKYGSMDALVIDEMGLAGITENEMVILFEILNERYDNKLTTVFVSNHTIKDLRDNILGDRVSDRIREDGVKVLTMAWGSARGDL